VIEEEQKVGTEELNVGLDERNCLELDVARADRFPLFVPLRSRAICPPLSTTLWPYSVFPFFSPPSPPSHIAENNRNPTLVLIAPM